jgi:hypothetical protein
MKGFSVLCAFLLLIASPGFCAVRLAIIADEGAQPGEALLTQRE